MMSTSLFNSEGFTDDILQHILGYLDESERFQTATVSKRFNKSADGVCIPYLLEIDSSTTHRVDAGFWSRLLEYVNTWNSHYRNNPASAAAAGDGGTVTLRALLDELHIPARALLHSTRRVWTKEMQGGPCTLLPGGNIAMYSADRKVRVFDHNLQCLLVSELSNQNADATLLYLGMDDRWMDELFYSKEHLLRKHCEDFYDVWKLEIDNDNNIHAIRFLYRMDLDDVFDLVVGSIGTIYTIEEQGGEDYICTIKAYDIATGGHLHSKDIAVQGFEEDPGSYRDCKLYLSGNHLLTLHSCILTTNEGFDYYDVLRGLRIDVLNMDEELTHVSSGLFPFQGEWTTTRGFEINMGRTWEIMDKTIFYFTSDGSNRMISIDDAGNLRDHDELVPDFDFVRGRYVLEYKRSMATASSWVYLLSLWEDEVGAPIGTVDEYNVATGSKERTLVESYHEDHERGYMFSILANDTAVYCIRNDLGRIQSFLP